MEMAGALARLQGRKGPTLRELAPMGEGLDETSDCAAPVNREVVGGVGDGTH